MKATIFGEIAMLLLFCSPIKAQTDELGVWTELNLKKKITKELNLVVQGEFRTTDGLSTADRWDVGMGANYRLTSWLKADVGYVWIQDRNAERVTSKGNIVSAYWQTRHRTNISLTAKTDWNNFNFSLRERWQYTYRPEKEVAKYDKDGITPKDPEIITGKGKNVLRSKFEIGYNLYKKRIVPFIYCELYTTQELEKTRLSAGGAYRINKNNSLELAYIYQNHSDDENKGHVLSISYSMKF